MTRESPMRKHCLLSCERVCYAPDPEGFWGWDVFEMSWELFPEAPVSLLTTRPDQEELVWRLLLGKLKPKAGGWSGGGRQALQGDADIWDRAARQNSLEENLRSRLFTDRPWLEGRRRDHLQLFHLLGLSVRERKTPLGMLRGVAKSRAWLCLVLCARFRVLVVRGLSHSDDAQTQDLLRRWLKTFSGGVLFLNAPVSWRTDCVHHLVLDSSGTTHSVNSSVSVPPHAL